MGWAQVGEPGPDNPVYKTVLSLGTNPTFADSNVETVESYILHDFSSDFYNQTISLVILAYLRPMDKYEGLDKLIKAIERDVRVGDTALDREEYRKFKEDEFFKKTA
jgi:riboflavin kinase/FMN adenylyltransferase